MDRCIDLTYVQTDRVIPNIVRSTPKVPSYGVVPKGLLTFLGSLYKEVAKTTSGTLVYRFERQTARKKYFFLRKALCPRLRTQDFISETFR